MKKIPFRSESLLTRVQVLLLSSEILSSCWKSINLIQFSILISIWLHQNVLFLAPHEGCLNEIILQTTSLFGILKTISKCQYVGCENKSFAMNLNCISPISATSLFMQLQSATHSMRLATIVKEWRKRTIARVRQHSWINRYRSVCTYNQHKMTMKKSLLVRKSPLARDSNH